MIFIDSRLRKVTIIEVVNEKNIVFRFKSTYRAGRSVALGSQAILAPNAHTPKPKIRSTITQPLF